MNILKTLTTLTLSFFFGVLAQAAPVVELLTTEGKIVLELSPEKAPQSVENFLRYTREGFYNGTVFHRVIRDFMIQGGGFNAQLEPKPTAAPIQNESPNGLKNLRGTLAMARTPAPHSATSQFFINHRDNPFLDYPGQDGWGYAVFGRVVQGMEVVDRIAGLPTGTVRGMPNAPINNILIQSANVLSDR